MDHSPGVLSRRSDTAETSLAPCQHPHARHQWRVGSSRTPALDDACAAVRGRAACRALARPGADVERGDPDEQGAEGNPQGPSGQWLSFYELEAREKRREADSEREDEPCQGTNRGRPRQSFGNHAARIGDMLQYAVRVSAVDALRLEGEYVSISCADLDVAHGADELMRGSDRIGVVLDA